MFGPHHAEGLVVSLPYPALTEEVNVRGFMPLGLRIPFPPLRIPPRRDIRSKIGEIRGMDQNDYQGFGWLCSCHAIADVRRMTCSSCSWGTNLLTGVMTPKRRVDDARSLRQEQPANLHHPNLQAQFQVPFISRLRAFPPSRRPLCSAPQQRGKPAPVFQSRRGNLISSNSHLHLLTASRIFDSQGNIDQSTSRIPCANTHSSACKPVAIHELPENARVWHVCISTDVQQFMARHMYHDFGRIGGM